MNRTATSFTPKGGHTEAHLPAWFWQTRLAFDHIKRAADSRLVNPDAVLYCTLARISAACGRRLTIDTPLGPATTVLSVAVVGPSGSGKSAAIGVAGELLGIPARCDGHVPGLHYARNGRSLTDELSTRWAWVTPWIPARRGAKRFSCNDRVLWPGPIRWDWRIACSPEVASIALTEPVQWGVLDANDRGDDLDAHSQLQFAAMLALLDGRMSVTGDDWILAGVMWKSSRVTRREIQGSGVVLAESISPVEGVER